MFTAWSPIRSRSVTIFIAVVMKRRSPAAGWWSASNSTHFSSISTLGVHLPIAVDDLLGQVAVALDERAHDPADLVLDQPPHGQNGLLEGVELFVEVARHDR